MSKHDKIIVNNDYLIVYYNECNTLKFYIIENIDEIINDIVYSFSKDNKCLIVSIMFRNKNEEQYQIISLRFDIKVRYQIKSFLGIKYLGKIRYSQKQIEEYKQIAKVNQKDFENIIAENLGINTKIFVEETNNLKRKLYEIKTLSKNISNINNYKL